MAGFFTPGQLAKLGGGPPAIAPKCGMCGLYRTCKSPKMPVTGRGRRGVLIVGEAPGATEDEQNRQFVGKSGTLLRETLYKLGINPDEDCWWTNAIICRPPDNATPTDDQLVWCRPVLRKTIEDLKPKAIITLGQIATKAVVLPVWKDDVGPVQRWAGFTAPAHDYNTWICPTYHPSYMLREQSKRDYCVSELWWNRHIKTAFKRADAGHPYPDGPPRYADAVESILDTNHAARIIRQMIAKGGRVAFDYEGTMLKPEGAGAEIVCCSVCWEGRKTISYPWHGDAIEATKELAWSNLAKIASNIKFEQRWTKWAFGKGVRNWRWDTMQTAHVYDHRKGITSIKFQAFLHLGQGDYNSHIEPYLVSDEATKPNRIKELPIADLLEYCGMDSLLEFLVAEVQARQFGEVL